MSVVPPLSGPPLYRYIPGVGRVGTTQNGPTGPTGPQGPAGTSANTGATGFTGATGAIPQVGNTLIVDAVYGNNITAAADPTRYPFLTIASALSNASSGQTVFVRPGTYLEKVTMPTGVALRGANVQTVTIAQSNTTSNTTLLTMGSNCRVEDVTLNLTSASNVNLTGVDWPSGTPLTSKLRTAVVNVTSSATGSNTIVGMLSSGTSATTYSASDAARSCTVGVDASSSGPIRGLYITGSNWFGMRDVNINARGTGSNIVGVETTNAGSYASLKHCTIRGGDASTNHYDINRTAGDILLGSVDLVNNTANGNSFSVATEGAITHYGTTGNFTDASSYNMVPGFVRQGDLPGTPFKIPVTQNMILFSGTFQTGPTVLPAGSSVKLSVYRNNVQTDVSLTISAGQTLASNTTQSTDFRQGDLLDLRFNVSGGNLNSRDFAASFAFY
jgi:hypothetical protein